MPEILGYPVNTQAGHGYGLFLSGRADGGFTYLHGTADLLSNCSIVVAGDYGAGFRTDLLFYRPTTGTGRFCTTDGAGHVRLLHEYHGWPGTYRHIVPGIFGGNPDTPVGSDLLCYDPTDGSGLFRQNGGAGQFVDFHRNTNWRRSWSGIVPGRFGGQFTDLFFCDADARLFKFYASDGTGHVKFLSDGYAAGTWRHVVTGDFGGGTGLDDLLAYDPSTGEATRIISRGSGDWTANGPIDLGAGWSSITAGRFTAGGTALFCASATQDTAAVITYDGSTVTTVRTWHPALPANAIVVAGDFAPTQQYTDLFVYLP